MFPEVVELIAKNDYKALKEKLGLGLLLNIQDENSWSFIMYAAYYGRTDAVKLLKNKGSDINLRDQSGRLALEIALSSPNNSDSIKASLYQYLNPTMRESDKNTINALGLSAGPMTRKAMGIRTKAVPEKGYFLVYQKFDHGYLSGHKYPRKVHGVIPEAANDIISDEKRSLQQIFQLDKRWFIDFGISTLEEAILTSRTWDNAAQLNAFSYQGFDLQDFIFDGRNWHFFWHRRVNEYGQQQWLNAHEKISSLTEEVANAKAYGRYLKRLKYRDGAWSVLYRNDLGYTDQLIHVSTKFPIEFISRQFKQGYSITSVDQASGEWVLVMSRGSYIKAQTWEFTQTPFVSDFHNRHIKDKYRISHIVSYDITESVSLKK